MKHILLSLLGFIVLLSLFVSCNGNKQTNTEEEILGKWRIVRAEADIITSDSFFSSETRRNGKPCAPR